MRRRVSGGITVPVVELKEIVLNRILLNFDNGFGGLGGRDERSLGGNRRRRRDGGSSSVGRGGDGNVMLIRGFDSALTRSRKSGIRRSIEDVGSREGRSRSIDISDDGSWKNGVESEWRGIMRFDDEIEYDPSLVVSFGVELL